MYILILFNPCPHSDPTINTFYYYIIYALLDLIFPLSLCSFLNVLVKFRVINMLLTHAENKSMKLYSQSSQSEPDLLNLIRL